MSAQLTPYGSMPTALEALRALVLEFDAYAEAMRAHGRGHEDYGCQRKLAHMVLATAATNPGTPYARTDAPAPIVDSAPEPTIAPVEPDIPIARSARPKHVKAAKPVKAPIAVADMTKDQLYAHYKASAPAEDLTFFLNATAATIEPDDVELAEALVARFDSDGRLTTPRPAFYKAFATLQDRWRQGAARRWAIERAGARTAALWANARYMDRLTLKEADVLEPAA